MWRAALVLVACVAAVAAANSHRELVEQQVSSRASYVGFKVFRVKVETEANLNSLKLLQSDSEDLDFWQDPINYGPDRTVDIMVPQAKIVELKNYLSLFRIKSEVLIYDLEQSIQAENPPSNPAEEYLLTLRQGHNFAFNKFKDYDSFVGYMKYLSKTFSSLVTLMTVGQSVEGRTLYGLKISSGGANKPVIFIDGGIHAREWISPAVVMYIVQSLVEDYKSHPEVVDKVDWYVMPMVNPDGYEFTRGKNRMWRKNRRKFSSGSTNYPLFPIYGQAKDCNGVDLNRNFPFQWSHHSQSSNKCKETYRGTSAQSEPETKALMNFVNQHLSSTKIYLSFHSYGNYWLLTCEPREPCYNKQAALAKKALRKMGTRYKVGGATELLYKATGVSDSWAKNQGIPYSFTIELPGKNGGFIIPSHNIAPIGKDIFKGVMVLAEEVSNM